ncbi:Cytochrome P450 71D8 [Hibiscus syriacus]|uniref:Cytochrome P450 71D8 n=1 Tax=Hibiscus syriacus TaxID=106335 RepID=A0A6A2YLU9_HIBSY|nr:cytochrome P450 71D9-like [Hibiscus syriacus]KAE8680310.1 Cytochrome P450 71D8 [Hibiscus syriacus]
MDPQILLAIILFALTVIWIWMNKSSCKTQQGKLPPGPWKLPLIGNMHHFIGSLPHRCLRDLANRHGPVMYLQLGELSNFVISSPEAAQDVMKTHDLNFSSRPYHPAARILFYDFTDIGFAPYGDYWRQLRKICTLELLSAKRVQSFRAIREEEVSNFVSSIRSKAGSPVNLRKLLRALTSNITARAAFGAKCKDREAFSQVVQEAVEIVGGFSLADAFPSFKLLQLLSGRSFQLEKLHRKSDKILENIIQQHRADRSNTKSGDKDEQNDLVHVLLNLQEHGNLEIPLTDSNIKAVVQDMFSAGGETTSMTIEWAMSEMLKNPKVLEKAQAEVRHVFNKRGEVNEESLSELKYLKLVMKETLRLHPALPLLLPRESKENCKINGYEIPAKSRVIINGWAIGRDPKYWTEAETFNPERFLNSWIEFKGVNFEYIPFGAGRRICPGIAFGMANVELPIAQLLYYFDWKLGDGRKLEELNMDEVFGATVAKKHELCLVPIPYHSAAH